MRTLTLNLEVSVAGENKSLGKISEDLDVIISKVRKYAPKVGSLEIKRAIQEAIFTNGASVWVGNHQIGIQLLGISKASSQVTENRAKFADEV
jgi:hypothetical protein